MGKKLISLALALCMLLALLPAAAVAEGETCEISIYRYYSDSGFVLKETRMELQGTVITETAQAKEGYIFLGWYPVTEWDGSGAPCAYGKQLSPDQAYTFTLDEDMALAAVYEAEPVQAPAPEEGSSEAEGTDAASEEGETTPENEPNGELPPDEDDVTDDNQTATPEEGSSEEEGTDAASEEGETTPENEPNGELPPDEDDVTDDNQTPTPEEGSSEAEGTEGTNFVAGGNEDTSSDESNGELSPDEGDVTDDDQTPLPEEGSSDAEGTEGTDSASEEDEDLPSDESTEELQPEEGDVTDDDQTPVSTEESAETPEENEPLSAPEEENEPLDNEQNEEGTDTSSDGLNSSIESHSEEKTAQTIESEQAAPDVTPDNENKKQAAEEPPTSEPVRVEFVCEPEETVVTVYDPAQLDENGEPMVIEPQKDGSYFLLPGEYLYDAECEGYNSIDHLTLNVTRANGDFSIVEVAISMSIASEDSIQTRGAKSSSRWDVINNNNITGATIVERARYYIGTGRTNSSDWNTRTGGTTPQVFDCSGLVYRILRDVGLTSTHSSEASAGSGTYYITAHTGNQKYYGTDLSDAVQLYKTTGSCSGFVGGDLLFFDYNNDNYTDHVGIYTGSNSIINSTSSKGTVETPLSQSGWPNGKLGDSLYAASRLVGSSGGSSYLSRCTYYPSHMIVKAKYDALNMWSLPCNSSTDSNSYKIYDQAIPLNATMTVSGLYLNTVNHYWFKCTYNGKTGYVYCPNVTYSDYLLSDVENGISYSGRALPSNHPINTAFNVDWTVNSTYAPILEISGYISDSEKTINGTTITVSNPSAASFSFSKNLGGTALDNSLPFRQLIAGPCKLSITVKVANYYSWDGENRQSRFVFKEIINHDFSVVSSGSHTHDMGTFLYYWAAHPHYNCYKCSICGEEWVDYNSSNYYGSCTICNPPTPEYYLDLNGYINGVEQWDIGGYGTADIYINGQLVSSAAGDYCAAWPSGTTYALKNIRPADGYAYTGKYWGANISGTISADAVNSGDDKISIELGFRSVISSVNESPAPAVYNGHTYYYFSTPVTWYDAKSICEHMGGHLATITSEGENSFVYSLAQGQMAAWLGATDAAQEGSWQWITGESYSYSNWSSGNPDNYSNNDEGAENYLHFSGSGGGVWNDNAGFNLFAFVCEKDTVSGWVKQDGKWYYYFNGTPATSWRKLGGKWYYFNNSGVMLTGWRQLNGNWYYFHPGDDGSMATGWKKLDGKWYYFNLGDSGVMQTGWKQLNGKWYYFNPGDDGSMATGWKKLEGKWYYFNLGDSGVMQTGWKQLDGKWYYFGSDGAMVTGWQRIDSKWYYFIPGDNGSMVANTTMTIDGKSYTFASSGECLNP